MLEQLVECENRLLEEQRRFNELLLAWRSGDLGDDLTRMKIEQMQREVDALGRQLTALRTVIAAQADRERAGYRQGAMPKAAYGWPAYGQAVAAAQPWNQTMPRPAAQTAEPGKPQQAYQQTPPQPAVQTAETGNPIPPAPGAMSQSARETGNPQQAYQQTPPRPVAAQAGYQQASGKQDLEKTIGRAILPVCAAGLIFLSLVFFAMLVLPYLSQGVKMVLMYTVSAAITLAGGILVAHDRRNKAFLGLLGCGMGAWYLSLFLSDFYFRAINDGILYLGLLVWAVVLCVLSRLRSNLFLIIGQIGVGISLILGVLMCNWTEDAERFLILSIYYAVTQTIFFVSHLRREYYRNAVNLVSWSIGLLILVLGAAASYTEGSAAGNVSVVLLLALAAVPVLLGVAAAEMDENGKLLGGIVGALCIIIFCGLFLNRFTGAALLLLVFGIAVLALLEFRRPGDLSAGTVLLEVAVFAQMFFAGAAAPYFGEYISTGLLAEACLLYGFLRKRKAYRAAALGYGILLLLIPMNGGMRTVWGLVFFCSGRRCLPERSDLFYADCALQYSGGESSAVSQKSKDGRGRKSIRGGNDGRAGAPYCSGSGSDGKTGRAGASPYLCAFGTGARVHQYLQPADKKGRRLVGNLRGVKAAAVCIGRTALLWGARVRERCDGHCDCVLLYRGGISGGNADEEKI